MDWRAHSCVCLRLCVHRALSGRAHAQTKRQLRRGDRCKARRRARSKGLDVAVSNSVSIAHANPWSINPNIVREHPSHHAIPSIITPARAGMDIKISKGTEEIPPRSKRAGEIAAAQLNRRKKIVNGTSIALGPFHHLKRPTSAPITSATVISVPAIPSKRDCHFSRSSTRG
jgi:hypothetical protein